MADYTHVPQEAKAQTSAPEGTVFCFSHCCIPVKILSDKYLLFICNNSLRIEMVGKGTMGGGGQGKLYSCK